MNEKFKEKPPARTAPTHCTFDKLNDIWHYKIPLNRVQNFEIIYVWLFWSTAHNDRWGTEIWNSIIVEFWLKIFVFFVFSTHWNRLSNNWNIVVSIPIHTAWKTIRPLYTYYTSYRLLPKFQAHRKRLLEIRCPFSLTQHHSFSFTSHWRTIWFRRHTKKNHQPKLLLMLYTQYLKWKWRAQSREKEKKTRIFDWHIFDTLIITVS